MIGGTIFWKSQLENSTVPSPPRVHTKSKRCGLLHFVSVVHDNRNHSTYFVHISDVQYRNWPSSFVELSLCSEECLACDVWLSDAVKRIDESVACRFTSASSCKFVAEFRLE